MEAAAAKSPFSLTNFVAAQWQQWWTLSARSYPTLDSLRGFIVVNMIIWHFIYDLSIFGYLKPYFHFSTEMLLWRGFIIYSFMFLFGLSLAIAAQADGFWRGLWQRSLRLLLSALLVSCATLIAFGPAWVYFGIFHFFFLAGFVVIPFLRSPVAALLAALVIGIAFFAFEYSIPWPMLKARSFEYIPPSPGLAFVLLGMAFASTGIHRWGQQLAWPRVLRFLGQHSILFYFIHLPLFFGGFWLLDFFTDGIGELRY